ncbi:MFS transporter [Patescibacteria group bacterium]|nr:MFS transporter [Patescibacteria group bacterium]MBU1613155.1 MFS transporter [Patescibacteria group bacterium]
MHKILRALILSDLFILGSFGLIQPIFAIFMINNITGATVTAIGVAVAIQLVTKSIVQIFVARWTDEERGNRRELVALFFGSILMSLVPLGYIFSHSIEHIFFFQFLFGLGSAMVYPGWVVVFMRYTRNDKAGFEWSLYNTTVSLGMAVAAFLGAYVAETFNFNILFVGVSILSFIGTGFIVYIFKHEFTRSE